MWEGAQGHKRVAHAGGGQNKLLFKTHTKTAHSRAILLPLILSGRCRDTPITVARNHSHMQLEHMARRVAGLLAAAHGLRHSKSYLQPPVN